MSVFPKSQSTPLVSIGIPTYNRSEGLRRSLEYLTTQTYQNLEILISDNASPDESTGRVIREFMSKDNRIKVFWQPVNRGIVFNFQFVLRHATGHFFMWAADDDEWLPNFVESCVKGFDDGVILVCPKMEIHWRLLSKTEDITLPDFQRNMLPFERIREFLLHPSPSMFYGLYQRKALLKVYDFENSFDFYDCALLIRILAKSPINILPDVLYRAGIDDAEYLVKPHTFKTSHRLIYLPFLKYTYRTFINSNMPRSSKLILYLLVIQFVTQNYLHHEKDFAANSLIGQFKYKIVMLVNYILNFSIK